MGLLKTILWESILAFLEGILVTVQPHLEWAGFFPFLTSFCRWLSPAHSTMTAFCPLTSSLILAQKPDQGNMWQAWLGAKQIGHVSVPEKQTCAVPGGICSLVLRAWHNDSTIKPIVRKAATGNLCANMSSHCHLLLSVRVSSNLLATAVNLSSIFYIHSSTCNMSTIDRHNLL